MVSAQKIIHALERGGFVFNGQKGSHYFLYHPIKELTTSVPVHGGNVKRSLLKLIIKQAGLSEDEFRKLL